LYSVFIEVAGRLYFQTGRGEFAEEAFAAAEENRAASLRELWAGTDLTKTMPDEYWAALAGLLAAETARVRGQPDDAAAESSRIRVAEMEARAGLDLPKPTSAETGGSPIANVRGALQSSDAFLGFYLGDGSSYLWIVTREGFELRSLPPRSRLSADIESFVAGLRAGSPAVSQRGWSLTNELFGSGSPLLLKKSKWILALDGSLFELPFAALPEPSGAAPHTAYIIENHAIQIVPGASAILHPAPAAASGPVVGVADPVYNSADPRLPQPAHDGDTSLELARLPGSAREIESCARVWKTRGYEPQILQGMAATKENLASALRQNPFVVHIAAHLIFPPDRSGPGLLALSPQKGGNADLLSATEIGGMHFDLGLMVLNGCSSAQAPALPGAGLMGMTRAWLAAGAKAVIATRWATSDQSGNSIFEEFYNRLPASQQCRRTSFAQLLQQAQIAELHAGGRRADPARWAAYFCVERD
jgi:hypothetical protein